MNSTVAVGIISGTLVAISAISAATIAVIYGSIDGASFSAIIGAAVGAVGGASATHLVASASQNNRTKTK